MLLDVERRKIEMETKQKMKEYQEKKKLKQLFTPKINRSRS
jgi:hypothetical protein